MKDQTDLGLLLLHALPLDGKMWAEQMSLLPNQTHAPNLYEFGNHIEVWAEKSLALTDAKRLIVVGCSVGGSCALEIAKLAPQRIAALVLIGTKARHDPNPKLFEQSLECVKNHGVNAAWRTYWEPLFHGQSDKEAQSLARNIALRQTKENLLNGLKAFHTRPSRDRFVKDFDFPIHVVTGEDDSLPGLAYSQELAASAKHGHLHVFKASGHYVPMVRAKDFNALLSKIIRTHETPQFGD